MSGKVTMRTCRHCNERFNPLTEGDKLCKSPRQDALGCEAKARGFAALSRERVAEIAKKGGVAAHAAGTAHKFTSDEAVLAGKRGGNAPHVQRGPLRKTA